MPGPDKSVGVAGLGTIRRRRDFLKAGRGRKFAAPTLVLQARRRTEDPLQEGIRLGITCSRRIGGAVARNRAKRRLREAARAILPSKGAPGWDYVLIGREGTTVGQPFEALTSDLEQCLSKVHGHWRKAGPTRHHSE